MRNQVAQAGRRAACRVYGGQGEGAKANRFAVCKVRWKIEQPGERRLYFGDSCAGAGAATEPVLDESGAVS